MQHKEDQDNQLDIEVQVEVRQLLSLPDTHIRDVWEDNFQEEMIKLMKLTQKFNVIAMDTEFPGMCVNRNEIQSSRSQQQTEYLLINTNVEETKLIQIGLTIADQMGNVPYPICTWQFNFKFDINKQKFADKSYDVLKKAGVQFDRLKSQGIEFMDFAQYFQASGFVYNPSVKWVVFHGSSDFAYLLRLVRGTQLPLSIAEFYHQLKKYFPKLYDLKYVLRDSPAFKDYSLAKLSYQIGCNRIGPQHQAGSDSLLTLCCYFKMLQKKQTFTSQTFDSSVNIIFGIGQGYLKNSSYQQLRQYQQSSFVYDCYPQYDGRNYPINHSHGMNYQMFQQNHPHGSSPLYNFFNHHTQMPGGYFMYPSSHSAGNGY